MSQRTIVVVEDEPVIASSISARLKKEGFVVHLAADGPSGVDLCAKVIPDLVILDVMLPGMDGFEVCRRIQRQRQVPVLMLTARDTETDILVGLGIGADDYMTKPFSPRELVARVNAILRRVDRFPAPTGTPVSVGDLRVDPASRRVTVGARQVHLTPIEFDLLHHMACRPGVVQSRDRLLAEVWGHRDGYGTRTVDTHIVALRKKIGPGWIRTVHGVGYTVEVAQA